MTEFHAEDEKWITRALSLAERGKNLGEVPVGAVVIRGEEVLGEGWNSPISGVDPTAHAEICALRAAALYTNNYRLNGCTVYVSVEPCAMCVGAMIHARIEHLVFATPEPKAGAVVSNLSLFDEKHFNHRVSWRGGVLAERAGNLLKEFFVEKRRLKK